MITYGLLGRKLGHSFSQRYFNNKFEIEQIKGVCYQLFEIENIEALKDIIADNPSLRGLNVTIPYKESVIQLIDNLDNSADKVQAVNVLKINDSEIKGYNTDYLAFKESLSNWIGKEQYQALVLGTGGAAKAVGAALNELQIDFRYVSRDSNKGYTYNQLMQSPELLSDFYLIINTSPLGMFPNVSSCPEIPYHQLSNRHYLYDLVYNPEETLFMKKGSQQGAKVKNGLEMLHLQAEYSWKIWNS